ncbi:hypothetical protein V5799_009830 [Amblyomma americanum]|uniref:SUN domain-containing protein n=1 Tax=Amblyomma americanum TaxID=6943 RepID=A0AAQ4FAW4_AMBAM
MEARRAPAVVAEMTRPDAPAMNDVTRVVKEMLAKYDADKTGLPDYALESAGGSVVNTRCTETYSNGGRRYYMFGLPIWTFTRSPRDTITGLESETDSSGRLLGSYTYDADGDTLQYFIVQTPEPAIYDYVEMKILSNHGNLDYTCLYRLRVHGEPAS